MASYWKIVNKVMREADILLLVLDARAPYLSINNEILLKIQNAQKKYLLVLNKADLVDKKFLIEVRKDLKQSIYVSASKKIGRRKLYDKILELSRGEACIVGVLGYPNVGKSSLINLLKGRKSASISPQAGHTRGLQIIKAHKIKMLDTPGVLPFKEKDVFKQVILGAIEPQQLKEPEYYSLLLIENYKEMLKRFYCIESDDPLAFLEQYAIRSHFVKRGARPDIRRAAVQLLRDWQRGKIHAGKKS